MEKKSALRDILDKTAKEIRLASICFEAHKCGIFSGVCTNIRRGKDCSGHVPMKPGLASKSELRDYLPEPQTERGFCKLCGARDIEVFPSNPDVDACLDCFVTVVLQRRPMPERRIVSTTEKIRPGQRENQSPTIWPALRETTA